MKYDDAEVSAWVPGILADAGLGKPDLVERESEGVANHVYRVDVGASRYVVRFGTGSDGVEFPKSAAIMAAVHGRVATQELLHADFSQTCYPCNIMVCSYLPGRPFGLLWPDLGDGERWNYLDHIVAQLRRLHEFRAEDIPFFADAAPWGERFLAEVDRWWGEAVRRGDFPAARLERIRARVDEYRWSIEQAPPSVLTHNDVNEGNVLFDGGALSGLIDFDDASIALPEWELWMTAQVLAGRGLLSERDALDWLRSSCGDMFRTEGCAERLVLGQIGELLWNLVEAEQASWTTREQGLRDADEIYGRVFESDFCDRWTVVCV